MFAPAVHVVEVRARRGMVSSHAVVSRGPPKYKQHADEQLSPFVLSLRLDTLISRRSIGKIQRCKIWRTWRHIRNWILITSDLGGRGVFHIQPTTYRSTEMRRGAPLCWNQSPCIAANGITSSRNWLRPH
ncbi:hypothetical protein AVEN_24572-1 [Araneus ventricosus]|uniref:Uncharacterized protein n=1 Tax=Araneus ventricosus TaxID=182803 RepID=A0A4Y2FG34_ARAVE|nr:hypothetical protein AVEN_24572-1 [Araneus ventricosus]